MFVKTLKFGNVDKANYYFVLVNIGLSVFSFIRSFVFMRFLDLRELGVISLVQTIFMFIGLLQMGLLNGGYRIISLGKKHEMEKTNNSIYSYLSIILPIGLLFCFLSSYYNWIDELPLNLLIISVVFGVFTLLNNWFHNVLIGEQKLTEVNILNVSSYGLALFALPLAFLYGFWGGMIVIMIQPFAFVALGVLRNNELLPTYFFFDLKYIKYILKFGFIPFLGGIFVSIYLQVERWTITEVLGVESLGGFYLVFLYVSLYQLIPNSINSIFFPKGVKAYSERNYNHFKSLLRYYSLVLIGYGICITIVTLFFLDPFVALFFPKHQTGVVLVYIILPGLILHSLSDPIGLVLNSSVILKPMLVTNLLNMCFCIVALFLMINMSVFSLQNVAVVRMVSGLFVLALYCLYYYSIRRQLYQ